MSRLDVLKAKGWPKLTKEEKDEYTKLLEGEQNAKWNLQEAKSTIQEEKSDTVEISKSTLQDLVSRLDRIEKEKAVRGRDPVTLGDPEWKESKNEKRIYTATLRKYRETTDEDYLYVVDLHHLKWEKNPDTLEREQIYKIYMFDPKDKETLEEGKRIIKSMSIRDFCVNLEREEVKISESKKNVLEKVTGSTHKTIYEYDKWKSYQGDRVPMTVTRDDIECFVEMENGMKFWINANKLNL